jgi:hypothetical protein
MAVRTAPALQTNALDSAAGRATERLLFLLNMMGQGTQTGYRAALECLWDAEPGQWCGPVWRIERAVDVLNLVVHAADFQKRLSDDQLADLVAFFIQRMKYKQEG